MNSLRYWYSMNPNPEKNFPFNNLSLLNCKNSNAVAEYLESIHWFYAIVLSLMIDYRYKVYKLVNAYLSG